MIKIKSVSIRNFLSIGNVPQVINLENKDLTLICGINLDLGGEDAGSANGCGKSAIFNAISYGLFSWPISDIKKEHLVNKTNKKNMVVEVCFSKDDKNYRIVRGLKPRKLEFYVNDKPQSIEDNDIAQGDSRETQHDIEDILGLSSSMFRQIVLISTYTQPFLLQKAADQREIIEQILGITILSEKAEKLKDSIKTLKDDIRVEEKSIESQRAANERIQASIEEMKDKRIRWNRQKEESIKSIVSGIELLENIDIQKELNNFTLKSQIEVLSRDKNTLELAINGYKRVLDRLQVQLQKTQKDREILEQSKCSLCGQKLEDDKHTILLQSNSNMMESILSDIEKAQKKIEENEPPLAEIREKLEKLSSGLDSRWKPFYKYLNEIHAHKSQLEILRSQLESEKNKVDPYEDTIASMESKTLLAIDTSVIDTMKRNVEHSDFLLKLLTNKDSFIRKSIIDSNLTYLNSHLRSYLSSMGLPHHVKFQSDLSVDISEMGRELSPGNLSRGEMVRLNLGLSFAFRDVFESLFDKINLLMLDESIDNGLDEMGADSVIAILKRMGRENRDVWLVSLRDEMLNKIPKTCQVIKEKGFTVIHNNGDSNV